MNSRVLFLAGNPALDFLNTRMWVNHEFVDFPQDDHDVIAWLKRAGFTIPNDDIGIERFSLLLSARKLRENIRSLLEKRKAGHPGGPFGPQRLFGGEPESLPGCVEQTSVAENRHGSGTEHIRIDSCTYRGSCRRVAHNCRFRTRENVVKGSSVFCGSSTRQNRTVAAGAARKHVETVTKCPHPGGACVSGHFAGVIEVETNCVSV